MDLVADFADRYGAPRPTTTWHEMLSLVKRTTRLELRDRLLMADGLMIGQPAQSSDAGVRQMLRSKLDRLAWPGQV